MSKILSLQVDTGSSDLVSTVIEISAAVVDRIYSFAVDCVNIVLQLRLLTYERSSIRPHFIINSDR
jgi:hypothetical protein